MAEIHEGGCLCGAVRYQVTGEPRAAFVCHCRFCQHASGSAFQIPVYFAKESVVFIGGPLSAYDHRMEGHGRILHLRFCPRCATKVGWTLERNPAVQGICGGTFDDPNWFKITAHLFAPSAVNWMAFPPAVPCFEKMFITEDGKPETPLPARSEPWRKSDLFA